MGGPDGSTVVNRADKLLAVLRDGREHSRHDVFESQGFMLTNNAASELRARGFAVVHRKKKGLDTYQLQGSLDEGAADAALPAMPGAPSSSELSPIPHASLAHDGVSPAARGGGQLALLIGDPA